MPVEEVAHRARQREGRDPDREGERFDRATALVAAVERAREHPTSHHETRLDVGVGEDHGEFVPADAERPVAPPDRVGRHVTERREQLVARRVAAFVVDLLEIVDVHEEQGQVGAVTCGLVELPAELLLERAVVAEPGQPIEERVLACATVEVRQSSAVVLETLDVAQDRPGETRHHERDGDRADGEEHDGQAVIGATRPEPLERSDAHEQHEFHREEPDGPAADRGRRPQPAGRVLFLGMVVRHGLPVCGIQRGDGVRKRCLLAPRPKYWRASPLGPQTLAHASPTVGERPESSHCRSTTDIDEA